jgi:hypothetical protein
MADKTNHAEAPTSDYIAREQAKLAAKIRATSEAATHGDSMLGPVIEEDTRSEEEKRLGGAWEVSVAASAPSNENASVSESSDPASSSLKAGSATDLRPNTKYGAWSVSTGGWDGGVMSEIGNRSETPKDEGGKESEPAPVEAGVGSEKAKSEAFEKNKSEWREKRDLANRLEADYAQKYEAHVLESSKKLRSLPRRMWGLQPKLTPELQLLKDKSDQARIDFNKAANNFLSSSENKRFRSRLEPKVATTLPLVHLRRVKRQEQILMQAWGESKYRGLKPALEFLAKHKYALTATTIGISALTTGGIVPVLTAIGAGLLVGGATKEGLGATYGARARENLKRAVDKNGTNFLARSYEEANREMEALTFSVGAREARTQTISAAVGVAAGIGAGITTAGYINGLQADQIGNVPPGVDGQPPPPHAPADGSHPAWENPPPNKPLPPHSPGDGSHPAWENPPPNTPPPPPPPHAPADGSYPAWENPPPDLAQQPDKLIEMGDAKVAEALSDKTAEVIADINAGIRPQPDFIDVTPPYDGPAHHTPGGPGWGKMPEVSDIIPPNNVPPSGLDGVPPDLEKVPGHTYIVERGDNLWNIMEGKGPDSNPVGGQSEALKDLSLSERRQVLDQVFDYYERHPEEAKALGILKSEGDIHRIYPGEQIAVDKIDAKILELMHQNSAGEIPTPEARPNIESTNEVPISGIDTQAQVVEAPPTSVPEPIVESPTPEVATNEPLVTDINKLTIGGLIKLAEDLAFMEPRATAQLEALGMDVESLNDMVKSLDSRVYEGDFDDNMTLGEYLNSTEKASPGPSTPTATPFDRALPQAGDLPVRDASFAGGPDQGIDSAAVRNYVSSVEKPPGFIEKMFFNWPNVTGTFDKIQGLTFSEIKEMATTGNLETAAERVGVDPKAYGHWMKVLEDRTVSLPAEDGETVGQYIARAVNANRVA